MAVNFLTVLPPETIGNIVESVEPDDYLQLKLTCKAIAAHMPERLQGVIRRHEPDEDQPLTTKLWLIRNRLRQILFQVERDQGKDEGRFHLAHLLCAKYHRSRRRARFVDSQRKPVIYREVSTTKVGPSCRSIRMCMNCGMSRYYDETSILVGGKKLFVCYICEEYHSVTEKNHAQKSHCIITAVGSEWEAHYSMCRSCSARLERSLSSTNLGKEVEQLMKKPRKGYPLIRASTMPI